jgi:DNA-binding NtrC family response regulator
VLTDLKMPGLDGVALLARLKALEPELPVLLLTAHGTVSSAIEAMRHGAFDYLQKPVDNDVARAAVARALEHGRLARENRELRRRLLAELGLEGVIACSPPMKAVMELALRAARSTASVLVSGESGTGKEVVAKAIHVHSPRVGGPLEAINCKALSAGVLESELFGHERGAFTGADRARVGLFERAHGGTLFLDELGEVDGDFQGKLLRVLQEGMVRRVGGDVDHAVDVRIVAATNRDLAQQVDAGLFRGDLYYRLAVVPIHIPPLRDRPEDVLPLAQHFLERTAREQGRAVVGWTREVGQWLGAQRWPGNVRELRNTMERGVVLARGELVELADVQLGVANATPASGGSLQETMDRAAAARIRSALHEAEGKRVDAAAALGIDRTTLYRLMKRYGIGP